MKKRIWAMTLAVVLALSLVPVSAVESLQEEEGAQWITVEGIEGGQIFFNSETGEIEDVSRKYGAEITKANIPSSINGVGVTSIGNGAFRGCTKLEEVTIPSGVIRIGSYAFEGCSTLPKIDLPESVTKIGEGCFSSCNSLKKVIIRAKDTELPDESINGQGVFRDCPRLTSAGPIGSECDIEFAWEEAIPIGLFAEFKSLKKMILPSTIREVYWDWQWCNNFSTAGPIGGNSDDIEFGWDTEIPDEAFSNLNGLTSVTLPDTITHIGEFAFGSCGKLSEINIPEMVSSIENGAFAGTGLQEIKIPDGVTCIESTLFSDCKELVEVLLPDKLTIIEEKAFSACPKLCKIDIPESVVSIGDYAFSGTGLREISIPNGVSVISEHLFYGCEDLSTVNIPKSVDRINGFAFSESGLEKIELPEGVPLINSGVFYECEELADVVLPSSIRGIGSNSFYGCVKLPEITIPENVVTIERSAFKNCSSLKKVTIPVSVTDIEVGAFDGCSSLAEVYYSGSESDWKKITIGSSNDELVNATIYYGAEDIEEPVENTLIFETNGGSKINALSVSADTTVDLTQYVPVKKGYTFAGWYSDSKLTTAVTSLKLTGDTTVYAKWTPAEYTLTFVTNGGSKINDLPVSAGTTVDLTKYIPTKEGCAFAGWYSDSKLTTAVTSLKLTADITVYAKWTPAEYTLTFATNGGSKINDLPVSVDTTVDLRQYVPVREGYDFVGWYADRKLTTPVTVLQLTEDTIVYAKWEETSVTLPFYDVASDDWFYEDVAYVYENGLMNGMGEGQFGPQGTTTRGMIVTILYRQAGSPAASGNPFTDVDPGQYYAEPIAWAASHGIVNGISATTFAPDAPITREQMATILYRYAQYQGEDVSDQGNLSAFADADTISAYAKQAMAWANGAGLINGVEGNRLNPTGQAVRCQAAAILHRFCTQV